jgi:hypothetical protein
MNSGPSAVAGMERTPLSRNRAAMASPRRSVSVGGTVRVNALSIFERFADGISFRQIPESRHFGNRADQLYLTQFAASAFGLTVPVPPVAYRLMADVDATLEHLADAAGAGPTPIANPRRSRGSRAASYNDDPSVPLTSARRLRALTAGLQWVENGPKLMRTELGVRVPTSPWSGSAQRRLRHFTEPW